ncbi:Protein CBG26120 [Caenorhabditis briggsae]|uniref:Protein CBG26120 n=1 Tax=Caenorhabditis briggsae TaxID=6238 RepID=B6IFG7_CAEBR|nr:Protein CBG26120 [Caenorhabditis briggsae]CAR98647.1 Protein CBG26120 [Caenorhabditis briggsae]
MSTRALEPQRSRTRTRSSKASRSSQTKSRRFDVRWTMSSRNKQSSGVKSGKCNGEVRDVAGYLKRTSVRSLLKSQPEKRKQDHEDAENLENRHGSSKRQRVPKRQWSE